MTEKWLNHQTNRLLSPVSVKLWILVFDWCKMFNTSIFCFRLSEIDIPNIPPVASSNLQHHESNQNQKVFEKSALELMVPLPVWDSSDEDENNRVPDIELLEEEPLDQIFESMENRLIQRQGEAGNHCPASNIRYIAVASYTCGSS